MPDMYAIYYLVFFTFELNDSIIVLKFSVNPNRHDVILTNYTIRH